MKTKKMGLTVLGVMLVFTLSFAGGFKVDKDQSVLKWYASKVTGDHYGTVGLQEGEIHVEDGKVVGGTVVADMSTIVDEDLTGEWNQKLVGHLKSDDFFSVEKYPTSKLILKDVKHKTGNEYTINGDLVIKGITKPVSFDAVLDVTGEKLTAQGKVVVDRTDYDIQFRSGKFFENLGDRLIHDEFTLNYQIVATK